MTRGTVLVHIGLPKTGTTSLQEVLRSWPALAGKPFDRPGGAAARAIQEAARAGSLTGEEVDRHLAAARELASSAADDLPVVWSAEALAGTPREWALPLAPPAEMAAQLAATTWDVRVLVTLRQPRAWLRSTFRYAIRGGYAQPYDRYLDRIAEDLDAHRGMAAWDATVGAWDAAVGAEAVAVAWFEDLVRDPAPVWDDIAARLALPGLRRLGAAPLPRLNEAHVGPPALELALNRHVLRSDVHRGRGPRLATRATYHRRIGSRLVRRSSDRWFTDRTTAREPDVVDRLATMAEELAVTHEAAVPDGLDLRG